MTRHNAQPNRSASGRPRRRHVLSDAAIRAAVQKELDHYSGTRYFHLAVDVMDRRVFVSGSVPLRADARIVQRIASRARDVAEVVDVLDVRD